MEKEIMGMSVYEKNYQTKSDKHIQVKTFRHKKWQWNIIMSVVETKNKKMYHLFILAKDLKTGRVTLEEKFNHDQLIMSHPMLFLADKTYNEILDVFEKNPRVTFLPDQSICFYWSKGDFLLNVDYYYHECLKNNDNDNMMSIL